MKLLTVMVSARLTTIAIKWRDGLVKLGGLVLWGGWIELGRLWYERRLLKLAGGMVQGGVLI